MSGKQKASLKLFLEKLKDIGFSDSTELKRDLERNVKYQHHELFLRELTERISEKNVVIADQISKYQNLSEQNEVISLQALPSTTRTVQACVLSEEKESASISEKLKAAQAYKEKLSQRIELLGEIEKESLNHEDTLQTILASSRRNLEKSKSTDQLTLDKFLQEVSNTNQHFSSIFSGYMENRPRTSHILRHDLESYFSSENDFVAQLTRYAKSQFSEASSWMDESLDQSLQLLSLTNTQLLEDESEQVREQISFDLKCAVQGYASRKNRLLKAKMSLARATAAVDVLDNRLKFYGLANDTRTAPKKWNLESLRRGIEAVQKQTDYLKDEVLPRLISRGLPLQQTHLLTGDCNKKLAQQKYYSKMQKKVISFLLQQCSRLSLIWMVLEVERARNNVTSRTVDEFCSRVSNFTETASAQTRVLRAHAEVLDKEPKAVIDNRDSVLLGLHQVLVPSSPRRSMFHTFDSVEKAAKKLSDGVRSCQRRNEQERAEIYPSLYSLKHALQTCTATNVSPAGEFELAPQLLNESLSKVIEDLNALKNSFPKTFNEVDKKKALLESDPDAAKKRRLWIDFLLHPDDVNRV